MLGASISRSLSWMSLPPEIRLMILEAIAQQKHPGWASFVSVCKEWQLLIENQNFRRLKLQAPCLEDLESIFRQSRRRRRLIQHIWLDVELPEYSWRSCKEIESYSWSRPNSKHWFKNFYFNSDNEDIEGADLNCSSWHDTQHGWVDGQQITTPPCSAVLRLFGDVDLWSKEDLPRVETVTTFAVRRQLRRRLPPYALWFLLRNLSGLERIIYEPWRRWERGWRVVNDRCFSQVVQDDLPQSLKRVSVFEDFSESLARSLQAGQPVLLSWQQQMEISRVVEPPIGAAFGARSVDLEQLSVAYMVNAEDFFGSAARNSSWTWHHLKSLALTSQLLRDTPQNHKRIDNLLYQAGITAARMPKLQDFALWYGIKGEACAFIHRRHGGRASITWRGTWDMQLSPRVVEAWQCVAIENHLCGTLQVGKQRVDSVIGSHGDAIHCLDLPCPVVAPASLWQIRMEGASTSQEDHRTS
ncbi:hypothetical protein QBC35DRAFT_519484 [Podospora australis]|uniref:DUF6546 domain-containing protein n=1 Tax=Podospora australis TaxID=1536484 RepID=A0AAN6X3J1_9PEZI|nr:hypothetical protein QBC35DRAFT_519484 [Podospora australis]